VIHFFWDRILGTYRRPDAGQLRRMSHRGYRPGLAPMQQPMNRHVI
jgi:hypothetical protein